MGAEKLKGGPDAARTPWTLANDVDDPLAWHVACSTSVRGGKAGRPLAVFIIHELTHAGERRELVDQLRRLIANHNDDVEVIATNLDIPEGRVEELLGTYSDRKNVISEMMAVATRRAIAEHSNTLNLGDEIRVTLRLRPAAPPADGDAPAEQESPR